MTIWRFERTHVLIKRVIFLSFVFFILFCVLAGRLFYLQVLQGEKYLLLAEKNRLSVRLTQAPRGYIYDRNGVKLAENKKTFQAVLIKEQAKDYKQTLRYFNELLPLDEDEMSRIERDISRKRAFMPIRIKDNLTFEEMSLLQLNAPDLPGIVIEEGMNRYYGEGDASTHVVGYVSLLNDKDLEGDKDNPLFDLPGYRIGRLGIEQAFEEKLQGTPGIRKTEVNVYGRSVRVLEDTPPIPGKDIYLTIDSRLQKYGLEIFGKETGSLILTDVKTGEILALVSAPSFDPNLFTVPLSVKNWKQLSENPKTPLQNKAIAGLYSPGSTFKIALTLAGLDSQDITSASRVKCTGRTKLGDQLFHCWKRVGHGHVNAIEALKHSCDVFYYEKSQDIGVDKIVQMADKLGFGRLTGIELKGEKKGLLPSRAWKEAIKGDGWRMGDTLNLSIGQGFLNATPIQLARMITIVANGGYDKALTLIKDEKTDEIVSHSLNIPKSHLNMVYKGMNAVVNEKDGTAYSSRFTYRGQKMAGKTASTQVRRISLKEREEGVKSQEDLPWKYRDHAMFVAFTPVDKPRYAVAVVVEHGGGGSKTAAPIASKMLQEVLRLEYEDSQKKKEIEK
ncbi:MAG: penicillin-binding protein 2 [Alphaproteobacteria bacterium]|nr:penicillin-binding protein 2 [Alphaproteobacteria bacterium]